MTPNSLLSLIFLAFIITISTLPNSSYSLSTVAITLTRNYTLICALIPNITTGLSYINCSTFPSTAQNPIVSDLPFSAIIGGNGFLCGLRYQSASHDSLSCWRFSENGTVFTYRDDGTAMTRDKRIYLGPRLSELQSGTSSFCAVFSHSRQLWCWQWPGFRPPDNRNFTSIAVGDGFLCWLSEDRKIECHGPPALTVVNVNAIPKGNFSVLAAGSRHACAIRDNGSVECWGELAGDAPPDQFESLALGEGRSCGIRSHERTVVCWGERDFPLPENLTDTRFIEIEAKGNVSCGIIEETNSSLICWGIENFGVRNIVFDRVLPGPCSRDPCPCKPMLNYSLVCATGAVCEHCEPPPSPALQPVPSASPPIQPASPPVPTQTPSPSGGSRGKVAFLVVGSVGCFMGLATIVYFLLSRYCQNSVHSSRVHDSGRLDEEAAVAPPQTATPTARRLARLQSMQPHLDRRLSALLSSGINGNVEEFPLDVLLRITNNFSDDHRIGAGSFGSVYQATLDDGREAAVKRAELTASSSYAVGIGNKREEKEYAFLSELAILSRVNHKNLLRLIGYSDEENERAIHRVEPNSAPRNVVDFAVPFIVSDEIHHVLDRGLPPPTPQEIEAVVFVGYLAADCVSLQGRDRPSMTEVVNSLERALAACLVQPSMSRSTTGSSTT
ncbi:hypothetical protein MRB53_014839 [Persea americana]|uniref:Uncharacterized protein n=1 Tax=Persea americana TaxID=3435 RepID=A0ACC2KBY2_PERAE|nr:hypothetical protein MRB53_014839 [Persea americana]